MALHQLKLPRSAAYLFGVVVLQKKLLKTLALSNVATVDATLIQKVWSNMDPEWVRKFCLGGQHSVIGPLQTIADASPTFRQALYDEFCRQNRVEDMLKGGGDFRDIEELPDSNPQLADAVKDFFTRCYALLSNDAGRQWNGYEFDGNRSVTNRGYKTDFCLDYPTSVVCPYCDGDIGTPELDHYLCKSRFPLLSCSPWNIVPVCPSCNNVITAKGDTPALTLGPPRSTDGWLHPFFRPASTAVQIKLNGPPREAVPELCSPDAEEQRRLNNHTALIDQLHRNPPYRSLSKRWTNAAAAYYDRLVDKVNRGNPTNSIDDYVAIELDDHLAVRGRSPSAMVHAAVCRAVLDRRPEYLQEFLTPNAPTLVLDP